MQEEHDARAHESCRLNGGVDYLTLDLTTWQVGCNNGALFRFRYYIEEQDNGGTNTT